jgi:hypothetical protein
LPLKQATVMLMRDERTTAQQQAVAGIRQLTHKQSRIMFFDVNAAIAKQSGGTKTTSRTIVESLCRQYMRIWI